MTGLQNTSERIDPFGAVDSLTPRERECLLLVAEHLRSKEIARKLGLSPLTVDKYIASACERLEVTSRHEAAQLVAKAARPSPAIHAAGANAPDSASLFADVQSRAVALGQRLDRWDERHGRWVRTFGQIASLVMFLFAIQALARQALTVLNYVLPANLFADDVFGRAATHPSSLAALLVGLWFALFSSLACISLGSALWRGRLRLVVAAFSYEAFGLGGTLLEKLVSGPQMTGLVAALDVAATVVLVAWWTIYPRRWLAICAVLQCLTLAADLILPSETGLNGQLWIICQTYPTLFAMMVIGIAAGAWPWNLRRLGWLRRLIGPDQV